MKKFEEKGRIWSYGKVGSRPRHIPARKCTMEVDFQPEELDSIQNNNIERPAIKIICSLYQGEGINDEQALKLFAWSELHLIRNQKFRSQETVDYNKEYELLLDVENKFSSYYSYVSVYKCTEGEYFITSDNPVLEIFINEIIIRIFVISPQMLVMMSPNSDYPITEINFTEMINSLIYANRYEYIFSHKKSLPLETFEKNAKKYNLTGKMKTQHFGIKNNS
ncbi:MAG: hypothetical protein ACTIM4_14645 [Marinomonas sp.]